MLVLRARGGEYERDFPYGVVRQLFEPLLAATAAPRGAAERGRRTRRADLRTGGGAGRRRRSVRRPARPPPPGRRPRRLGAAAAARRRCPVGGSCLAASPRPISAAASTVCRAALAFTVRTGEPGEHGQLLDELRREPGAQTIEPPPLSAGAAAALVDGGGRAEAQRGLRGGLLRRHRRQSVPAGRAAAGARPRARWTVTRRRRAPGRGRGGRRLALDSRSAGAARGALDSRWPGRSRCWSRMPRPA